MRRRVVEGRALEARAKAVPTAHAGAQQAGRERVGNLAAAIDHVVEHGIFGVEGAERAKEQTAFGVGLLCGPFFGREIDVGG